MVLQTLGEDGFDAAGGDADEGGVLGVVLGRLSVSFTAATRRSMVRTSSTRMVSRAATASTTTKPPITAPHQR